MYRTVCLQMAAYLSIKDIRDVGVVVVERGLGWSQRRGQRSCLCAVIS
jgi:hypothetical protein